jgi:hypothetical protein
MVRKPRITGSYTKELNRFVRIRQQLHRIISSYDSVSNCYSTVFVVVVVVDDDDDRRMLVALLTLHCSSNEILTMSQQRSESHSVLQAMQSNVCPYVQSWHSYFVLDNWILTMDSSPNENYSCQRYSSTNVAMHEPLLHVYQSRLETRTMLFIVKIVKEYVRHLHDEHVSCTESSSFCCSRSARSPWIYRFHSIRLYLNFVRTWLRKWTYHLTLLIFVGSEIVRRCMTIAIRIQ